MPDAPTPPNACPVCQPHPTHALCASHTQRMPCVLATPTADLIHHAAMSATIRPPDPSTTCTVTAFVQPRSRRWCALAESEQCFHFGVWAFCQDVAGWKEDHVY
eukprot:100816-Chlamydomonas_euryale.AAC.5